MNTVEYSKKDSKCLLSLISLALGGKYNPDCLKEIDWKQIYTLSLNHSIPGIIGYAIKKLDDKPNEKVCKAFETENYKAFRKQTIQEIETNLIKDALAQREIKYILLKGSVVKALYPESVMRTMGDIDILIEKEKNESASEAMLKLGYTLEESNVYNDLYLKEPLMAVELHRYLTADIDKYNFSEERAIKCEGADFEYKMPDEDVYVHLVVHAAEHYFYGGTGIRTVLDIWVYNNALGKTLDREYIKSELEKLELYGFEQKLNNLCAIWFEGKRSEPFYEDMEEYIVSNGTYGKLKNQKISDFNEFVSDNKGFKRQKAKYVITSVFPGVKYMSINYPWVKKYPILLPTAWIVRGFDCVFHKRKFIKQKLDKVTEFENDEAQKLKELYKGSN